MPRHLSLQDVQETLSKLANSAKSLNDITDELTKQVLQIQDAVNNLNLGVSTSIEFSRWSDEEGIRSGLWRLAYGKGAGKWGFAIEYITEDIRDPREDTYESWLFKDAPRDERVRAVDYIPDLLQALLSKSEDVAANVNKKLNYAKELSSAIPTTGGQHGREK